MIIGIDIDNTIAPTFKTIIKYMNKKYNLKKKPSNSKESTNYDLFYPDFNDFRKDWNEFVKSKDHSEMKPINDSVRVIKKLNFKHNIYILTARANDQKGNTLKWINKHFKNKFDEVLFLNYANDNSNKPLYTKGDLCKKYNINTMIEDDLSQLKDISEKSPKTKLFLINKNNQYTWDLNKKLPKNTKKIETWKDFEKEIEKIDSK